MKGIVKNINRLLAMLLLAVFAFAIMPRELWHHCESENHHYHSSASHSGEHEMAAAEDCPVCDFQLLPYYYSIAAAQWDTPDVFIPKTAALYQDVKPEIIQEVPVRGPPAFL